MKIYFIDISASITDEQIKIAEIAVCKHISNHVTEKEFAVVWVSDHVQGYELHYKDFAEVSLLLEERLFSWNHMTRQSGSFLGIYNARKTYKGEHIIVTDEFHSEDEVFGADLILV
jgi:hypothetical protein